jgi:hypothetical protein
LIPSYQSSKLSLLTEPGPGSDLDTDDGDVTAVGSSVLDGALPGGPMQPPSAAAPQQHNAIHLVITAPPR